MSATGATRSNDPIGQRSTHGRNLRTSGDRRLSTETKAAFKTTEFFAYLAFLAALFIAGAVLDESNAGGLGGKQVWLYGTILTVGYMISRGLAKAGSRDPYWDERGDRNADH